MCAAHDFCLKRRTISTEVSSPASPLLILVLSIDGSAKLLCLQMSGRNQTDSHNPSVMSVPVKWTVAFLR